MTVNSSLGYLISEGFKSVFKQKKMSSASIVVMCATMFIFGIFFLIGENVNYAMKQVESKQGMRVIIKEDATDNDIANLKTEIQKINGVSSVTYYSKEDALDSVKKQFGDHQDLLEGYSEDNPFPASYFVTLTDLDLNEQVQEKIKSLDFVDEISTNNNTIANLSRIARTIQNVTLVLLLLLIIISILIIAYTIKLTVYARRREISIMKYVGATNSFIRGPFVIEGVIIGVVAAFLTLVIICVVYNYAIGQVLNSSVISTVQLSFYTFSDLFAKIVAVYLILGIGLGVIGSSISMRKYLKV